MSRHTLPVVSRAETTAAPTAPARFGRRLLAVFIDWGTCLVISLGLLGYRWGAGGAQSFIPLAVFALENLLLVGTLGHTVGHRLLGLQVRQVRPGVYPLQVAVRTALLCLFLPAIFTASDGRGLHDIAAGTTIVRR